MNLQVSAKMKCDGKTDRQTDGGISMSPININIYCAFGAVGDNNISCPGPFFIGK